MDSLLLILKVKSLHVTLFWKFPLLPNQMSLDFVPHNILSFLNNSIYHTYYCDYFFAIMYTLVAFEIYEVHHSASCTSCA